MTKDRRTLLFQLAQTLDATSRVRGDRQLAARLVLGRLCRDDVFEAPMSPEFREIVGIVTRAASARLAANS